MNCDSVSLVSALFEPDLYILLAFTYAAATAVALRSQPKCACAFRRTRPRMIAPLGDARSFLQLPVNGLFFHPMNRRCLTSFSVTKGWNYYANVRYRDINVESSSKRSYFGLNALYFAARCVGVAQRHGWAYAT